MVSQRLAAKVSLFSLLTLGAQSFEIRKLFSGLRPIKQPDAEPSAGIFQIKDELLEAVSFTSNGSDASIDTQKQVLDLVARLESLAPVKDTLLTDPEEAKRLDGEWFLQYTQSSDIGQEDEVSFGD